MRVKSFRKYVWILTATTTTGVNFSLEIYNKLAIFYSKEVK